MEKQLKSVREFEQACYQNSIETPQLVNKEVYYLRHGLMYEENEEYLEACNNGNLVEIADALGDQLYVLCGTILAHGMESIIEKVFDEIHRSNMSKFDENGKPIFREDGKLLKSSNYSKPNLENIVNNGKI